MLRFLSFVILLVSGLNGLSAQSSLQSVQSDCVEKYELSDKQSFEDWFEYNGTDANIKTYELVVPGSAAETKWEKKKADRNCLSPDPNDCLVWCLTEIPASPARVFEVIWDTGETLEYRSLPKIYSTKAYVEIDEVCYEDYNSEILIDLSKLLVQYDYNVGAKQHSHLNGKLLKALNKMQKDFFLPIGKLNGPTLNALQNLQQ